MIGLFFLITTLILLFAQIIQPHPQDIYTFYHWMQLAFERGIFHIYQWTPEEVMSRYQDFSPNYPPFIFSLYPVAYVLHHLNLWPNWPSVGANLFFRIPLITAQLSLCFLIYRELKTRTVFLSRKWCVLLLFLNPAFIIAGPVWGQLNFILWGVITLSCLAWEDHKPIPSALWAALGATIKPQFVMFLPLIAFLLVKRRDLRFFFLWLVNFLLGLFILCSPFILTSGLTCLTQGYMRFTQGQYATADIGYNFWWTLFNGLSLESDSNHLLGVPYSMLATLVGNGLVAAVGFIFCFNPQRMSWTQLATLTSLILFCFLPGMNPQCLVFGTAFLCFQAIQMSRLRFAAILLSLIQCLNLAFNAFWTPNTRFYLNLPTYVGRGVGTACFLAILLTLSLLIRTRDLTDSNG